jgi:hypothetical protein
MGSQPRASTTFNFNHLSSALGEIGCHFEIHSLCLPESVNDSRSMALPHSFSRFCAAFVTSCRFVNSRRRCRRTGNCDFVYWGLWVCYDKFATCS